MPLTITDEQLQAMHMSEPEARIEFACHCFDAGKLTLPAAATFAGLSRVEMEGELRKRGIAIYRPTVEDLHHDLEVLKQMGV